MNFLKNFINNPFFQSILGIIMNTAFWHYLSSIDKVSFMQIHISLFLAVIFLLLLTVSIILNLQLNKRLIQKNQADSYTQKFCVLWDNEHNPRCISDKFPMYLYDRQSVPSTDVSNPRAFDWDKLKCSHCNTVIPLLDENGYVLTLEEAREYLKNIQ